MDNNYPPTNPQSNYQRGNAGGTGWVRPPGVYFELIGESFNLMKAQLGTWLIVSLVALIVSYGLSFAVSFGTNLLMAAGVSGESRLLGAILALILYILGSTLSTTVMMCFFCGFGRMAILQAQGRQLAITDLFVPFRNFSGVLFASLAYNVAVYLGLLLLIIPGIYLAGRLGLAPYYAGIRGDSAGAALKESWDVAKPHAWGLFALFFVAAIVTILGLLLCGIGLLFTFPILGMVMGLTYATFAQQRNPVSPA